MKMKKNTSRAWDRTATCQAKPIVKWMKQQTKISNKTWKSSKRNYTTRRMKMRIQRRIIQPCNKKKE
mgnify:CR=1 FL=1